MRAGQLPEVAPFPGCPHPDHNRAQVHVDDQGAVLGQAAQDLGRDDAGPLSLIVAEGTAYAVDILHYLGFGDAAQQDFHAGQVPDRRGTRFLVPLFELGDRMRHGDDGDALAR